MYSVVFDVVITHLFIITDYLNHIEMSNIV